MTDEEAKRQTTAVQQRPPSCRRWGEGPDHAAIRAVADVRLPPRVGTHRRPNLPMSDGVEKRTAEPSEATGA